jgi:hypothetical protein
MTENLDVIIPLWAGTEAHSMDRHLPWSLLQRARGNGSALLGMSMSWAVGQGRDDQAGENWRSTRGVRCTYTMKYALTFLRLFVSNRQTANFGLGVHASYKSYHVGFPTLFQKGP